MDLNQLAQALVTQLTRIADAAEGAASGAPANTTAAAKTTGTKTTGTKTTAAAKTSKPKTSRETMEKALLAIKDHPAGGKTLAQEVFSGLGYAKMGEIEEKDFDKIFAAAEAKLEELNAEGDESGAEDDI